ncbi:hypothetical protein AAF712_015131 [Marasmius tenuissimus]|uniref:Uncharacterized protein n=1 Tax=Marasmius tenuissimus TaxID=585030 RepID=A0ABR2ZA82_9AGAR
MVILKRHAAVLPAASLLASKKRYGIVKSLLTPHHRRPRRPSAAPVPEALKILRRQRAKETREAINKAVKKWEKETRELAESLAKKYRRKDRYFLDLLFQGGVRLSREQRNANPFNAIKYVKAHNLREQGIIKTLMQIMKEYKGEYEELSKQGKKDMVTRYKELKAMEIEALSLRVGVEGFFCIVRDRIEDFMEPQWYFSNPAIKKLFTTDKERIAALKSEIVDLVKERLDKAAGRLVPRMFYAGFAQHITWNYGVVAGHWPVPDFGNPSKGANDVVGLTAIRNAIRDDADKPIFVRLSDSKWASWKERYREEVEDGTVVQRERQGRSDKGKPRKKQQKTAQENRAEDAVGEDEEDEGDAEGECSNSDGEEGSLQKSGKRGQGTKKGNGKNSKNLQSSKT